MIPLRSLIRGCLVAGLIVFPALLAADTYILLLQGVVTMPDGSPPPKTTSVERICSDIQGSGPGPLFNKKGEYFWRMEVDPMRTRTCVLRAHLDGYASSEIDISALNSYSNPKMPPITLTAASGDPTVINVPDGSIPGKARAKWKAAMKAVDGEKLEDAQQHLREALQAAPKFAGGWNALGLVYGMEQKPSDAKDAYEHAIPANPKLLSPYVNLARMYIFNKDWENAAKIADTELKIDTKHIYSEIYLHQAVARYCMKDLDGAEMSARQAQHLDQTRKGLRAEYVLGRILEGKGDFNGARDHMTKYLQLDPKAADADQIKAHIEKLGKPDAPEPDLELL